ncbi:cell envelope integrity protein TolA [Enterobacter sp. MYb186]
MSSRHLIPLLLLLSFLLTACAGNNQKSPKPPGPSVMNQEQLIKAHSYAEQINQVVTEQLSDIKPYRGKKCTIWISILRDGMVMNATVEKGDPGLCQTALSALTRAKIPPAPDDKTWQIFKNVPLDFAP